jgi:hypothetical protein
MASFNSSIIFSGVVLCIIAPKALSSVFYPAKQKQPEPKYFMKTGSVSGCFVKTSPIVDFFVIVSGSSLINFYLNVLS